MCGEASLQGEVPVYVFLWGKEYHPVVGQEACSTRSSMHILRGRIGHLPGAILDDSCLALLRQTAPLLLTRWGCLAQRSSRHGEQSWSSHLAKWGQES